MDIARAVQKLYPGANFRRSDTYPNLVLTWQDKRKVPTEAQLMVAWEEVQQEDYAQAAKEIVDMGNRAVLQDDLLLAELSYEQRVDLHTNILRMLVENIKE